MKQIYLDSCIVIYLIEGELLFHQNIRMALAGERRNGIRLSWSFLTHLECLVMPKRRNELDLIDHYERFFMMPSLIRLDFSAEVFAIATELRAFQNLKTPDALHLAAAIHHGCTEFWTNDLRLKAAAANRIQIINPLASAKE